MMFSFHLKDSTEKVNRTNLIILFKTQQGEHRKVGGLKKAFDAFLNIVKFNIDRLFSSHFLILTLKFFDILNAFGVDIQDT